MDKGNYWGTKFANSTDDFEYFSMENVCKKKSISKPKSCNFDGFLKRKDSKKLIPFEHTEAVQNPTDYVLEKIICTGYKPRKPLKIPESTRSNQISSAVEEKHKKSEGYFECVTYLEKHGVFCSQEAFLVVDRFNKILT